MNEKRRRKKSDRNIFHVQTNQERWQYISVNEGIMKQWAKSKENSLFSCWEWVKQLRQMNNTIWWTEWKETISTLWINKRHAKNRDWHGLRAGYWHSTTMGFVACLAMLLNFRNSLRIVFINEELDIWITSNCTQPYWYFGSNGCVQVGMSRRFSFTQIVDLRIDFRRKWNGMRRDVTLNWGCLSDEHQIASGYSTISRRMKVAAFEAGRRLMEAKRKTKSHSPYIPSTQPLSHHSFMYGS